MGQYFNWVNFDKNEIIEDWPWSNGNKLHESAYLGCEETDAALTMLAGDWRGISSRSSATMPNSRTRHIRRGARRSSA